MMSSRIIIIIFSLLAVASAFLVYSVEPDTPDISILQSEIIFFNISLFREWNLISLPVGMGGSGETSQSECSPLVSGDDRAIMEEFFTNHSDSVSKSELIGFLTGLEEDYLEDAKGPAAHRVFYSISADGLNFTSETPIINSTSVPDAVRMPGGEIRIYGISGDSYRIMRLLVGDLPEPISYEEFDNAMCPVGVPNDLATFRSEDGISFVLEVLRIVDLSLDFSYADPSVVLLDDGSVRLYFMGANKSLNWSSEDPASAPVHHIFSAVSEDGSNFTMESGYRFTGSDLTDPDVLRIGEEYRMYWNSGRMAISSDGLDFSEDPDGLGFYVFCLDVNEWFSGGYRMYYNGGETFTYDGIEVTPSDLITSFSSDGLEWTRDPGMRMGGSGCGSLITINSSYHILYTLH